MQLIICHMGDGLSVGFLSANKGSYQGKMHFHQIFNDIVKCALAYQDDNQTLQILFSSSEISLLL